MQATEYAGVEEMFSRLGPRERAVLVALFARLAELDAAGQEDTALALVDQVDAIVRGGEWRL